MAYNFFARCGTGVSSYYIGSTKISGTSWQSFSSAYQTHDITKVVAKSGYESPYELWASTYNPSSSSSTDKYYRDFYSSDSISGNTNDYSRYVEIRATASSSSSYTLTVKRDTNKYIKSVKFSNGQYATFDDDETYDYVDYDSALKISSVTFTSAASKFTGTLYWKSSTSSWQFATVTNGSVSIISSHEQIDCTGDRTITLVADGSLTKTYYYRVSYYPNGGQYNLGETAVYQPSSGYYSTTSNAQVSVTLSPPKTPYLDGYDFQGWAITATSSTVVTSIKTTPTENGSTYPVYAVWKAKAPTYYYRIRFDPNGGSFPSGVSYDYDPSSSSYYSSETQSVKVSLDPNEIPERTNYEFVGWGTSSTSTSKVSSVTFNASTGGYTYTVYAIWQPIYKYQIAYSANGGQYSDGVQVKYTPSAYGYYTTSTQSVKYTLSAPATPLRDNYEFVGWSTSSTSSVTTSSISVTAQLNGTTYWVYAVWKPIYKYRVAYSANGGQYSDGSQVKYKPSSSSYYTSYDKNVTYTLSTPGTLSKVGYDFVGWATTATSSVAVSEISLTAQLDGTVSWVYAIWKASVIAPTMQSVTVTYDGSTAHLLCSWTSTATSGTTYAYVLDSNGNKIANSAAVASSNKGYSATLSVPAGGVYKVYARHQNGELYVDSGYIEVSTKPYEPLFHWHDTQDTDNLLFVKGKNISDAVTAAAWNKFLAKVASVQGRTGKTKFTYTTVNKGDGIKARPASGSTGANNTFNEALTQLASLNGTGTYPSSQNAGDPILASLFVGASGSLKSALNNAINTYNNNR